MGKFDLNGWKLGTFIFAESIYLLGMVGAPSFAPRRVALENQIKSNEAKVDSISQYINNIEGFFDYTRGYEMAVTNPEFRSMLDGLAKQRNKMKQEVQYIRLENLELQAKYDDWGDKVLAAARSWFVLLDKEQ